MFDTSSANYIIIVLITLAISVSVHEAMHGLMARYLGDTTAHEEGRITLNPLKHVDVLLTIVLPAVMLLLHQPPIFVAKPVPFDPRRVRYGEFGAALVGVAGPVSNLLLAVVSALVIRAVGVDLSPGWLSAMIIFTSINISLFVFNMLPIPPLDGSRLLYAFAPDPLRRIMEQIEAFGFMIIIVVLLLLSSFIGPIIGGISESIFTFLLS